MITTNVTFLSRIRPGTREAFVEKVNQLYSVLNEPALRAKIIIEALNNESNRMVPDELSDLLKQENGFSIDDLKGISTAIGKYIAPYLRTNPKDIFDLTNTLAEKVINCETTESKDFFGSAIPKTALDLKTFVRVMRAYSSKFTVETIDSSYDKEEVLAEFFRLSTIQPDFANYYEAPLSDTYDGLRHFLMIGDKELGGRLGEISFLAQKKPEQHSMLIALTEKYGEAGLPDRVTLLRESESLELEPKSLYRLLEILYKDASSAEKKEMISILSTFSSDISKLVVEILKDNALNDPKLYLYSLSRLSHKVANTDFPQIFEFTPNVDFFSSTAISEAIKIILEREDLETIAKSLSKLTNISQVSNSDIFGLILQSELSDGDKLVLTERIDQVLKNRGQRHARSLRLGHTLNFLLKNPYKPEYDNLWDIFGEPEHRTEQARKKELDPNYIVEPSPRERSIVSLVEILKDPVARIGITRLLIRGSAVSNPMIEVLTLNLGELIRNIVDLSNLGEIHPDFARPQSRHTYPLGVYAVRPNSYRKMRLEDPLVIIGGGPASIMLVEMRRQLGYHPEETVVLNNRNTPGGIWNNVNVLQGGHNTFAPLNFLSHTLPAKEPRPGADITKFLGGMIAPNRDSFRNGVSVKAVSSGDNGYLVTYQEQGAFVQTKASAVVVATGATIPRDLNSPGSPIKFESEVENFPIGRWQFKIKPELWTQYHNTTPVIVGLGNSTLEMLSQYREMREAGINVKPIVLTHFSDEEIRRPTEITATVVAPSKLVRGRYDLTKLELDIERIKHVYDYAIQNGWIVGGVKSWRVNADQTITYKVGRKNTKLKELPNVPNRVQALIGYKPDYDFLARLGVMDSDTLIDPVTGKFTPKFEDSHHNIYAMGSLASTAGNRNNETMPGMVGMLVPNIGIALALRDSV